MLNPERALQIIGWVWMFWGISMGLTAFPAVFDANISINQSSRLLIAVSFLLYGAISMVAAYGIFQRRSWSRKLMRRVAGFTLILLLALPVIGLVVLIRHYTLHNSTLPQYLPLHFGSALFLLIPIITVRSLNDARVRALLDQEPTDYPS